MTHTEGGSLSETFFTEFSLSRLLLYFLLVYFYQNTKVDFGITKNTTYNVYCIDHHNDHIYYHCLGVHSDSILL